MNSPVKVYHELRKVSPEKARMLVRNILEKNNSNVSKTARILGISHHTVRRARDELLIEVEWVDLDEMEKIHRKANQKSVRIHPKHRETKRFVSSTAWKSHKAPFSFLLLIAYITFLYSSCSSNTNILAM